MLDSDIENSGIIKIIVLVISLILWGITIFKLVKYIKTVKKRKNYIELTGKIVKSEFTGVIDRAVNYIGNEHNIENRYRYNVTVEYDFNNKKREFVYTTSIKDHPTIITGDKVLYVNKKNGEATLTESSIMMLFSAGVYMMLAISSLIMFFSI